jgi:hypothetical protein
MGKNKMITKVDKKTGEHVLTRHGKSLKNKANQEEITKSLLSKKFAFSVLIKKYIVEFLDANPQITKEDVAVVIPQEAITLFANRQIEFNAVSEKGLSLINEISEDISDIHSKMTSTSNIQEVDEYKNFTGVFNLYPTQQFKHKFKGVENIYGQIFIVVESELLGMVL